jgi:hypothetical protein
VNEDQVIQYITGTFEGVETQTVSDNTFFFYASERMFPFTTLVTNDDYEQVSNLNRPGVFRLNIGVSKQTFQALFGTQRFGSEEDTTVYDFAALDQVMPHPVYGKMYWVGILNPSPKTFQTVVQPLLAEAYDMAVKKYLKKVDSK